MLAAHGSPLDAKNEAGETPLSLCSTPAVKQDVASYLHYPCIVGDLALAREILHKTRAAEGEGKTREDARFVNCRDSEGNTPCHVATQNGHLDLLELLLEHGCDFAARNDRGQSAVSLVRPGDNCLQIVRALLMRDLPFVRDAESGVVCPNPAHGYSWTTVLDAATPVPTAVKIAAVDEVFALFPDCIEALSRATDAKGRVVMETTDKAVQTFVNSFILIFGRYRLLERRPEHVSATCILYRALDEEELDEQGKPARVALKLMTAWPQFAREVWARRRGGFDEDKVVRILRTHPEVALADVETDLASIVGTSSLHANECSSSHSCSSQPLSKPEAEKMFCVVLPLADRNLFVAIKQERFAGRDLQEVRRVFLQLLHCVAHVHSRGMIHADLKPLNCCRLEGGPEGARWKLIDLDASCRVGLDVVGVKCSSAYMPPESLHHSRREARVVPRDPASPLAQSMEYPLLQAHASFDVWSLGCILYQLCSLDAKSLFHTGADDNLSSDRHDEDNLFTLHEWTAETKERKLAKISDPLFRNLVSRMLCRDAARRIQLDHVIAHPCLSGKHAFRLPHQAATYDCFISYRVASDLPRAEALHHCLTKAGLRVFWDKACLRPGENWKKAFVSALVGSATFVCLLSKAGLEGWGRLDADSPTDNFLLEHRLALELVQMTLCEKIYPVLIGPLDPAAAESRGGQGQGQGGGDSHLNFFSSGGVPSAAPATPCAAVERDLHQLLDDHGLGSPLSPDKAVAAVLSDVLSWQGHVVEGSWAQALGAVERDVVRMVGECSFAPMPMQARATAALEAAGAEALAAKRPRVA